MSVRWSIAVSDDIARRLRQHLAENGGRKGDMSRFVEKAVREALFFDSLEPLWEHNWKHDKDLLSDEEVQALSDRAVAEVRAEPGRADRT